MVNPKEILIMKKISSLLVLGLALVLSCTKEGPATVNRIEDMYTVPADAVVLNTLDNVEASWSLDRRYFDLTLSGNGSTLTTTLIGYEYFLAPGQYVFSPAVTSNIGNAVVEATKVNGTSLGLDGYILVNKKGSNYQITAVAGEKTYFFSGEINFEPDPDPLVLTEVMTAQKGEGIVTMQLTTGGISSSFDYTTWTTVWEGEGYYLGIDLYSADGYLADGVYKPCAQGGVVNSGEFGIGWDNPEMGDFGLNWGTCLFEVGGGTATALEKITDGIITVTSREEKVDDKDVVIWTIFWGVDYPTEILFEGAIPALTRPKKPVGPVVPTHKYTIGEPSDCSTQSGDLVTGVKKYPVTVTDADDKEVAYLEFVLTEGSEDLVEGEYVSTEYAHEAGQLANGYSIVFGDWAIAGGSYYMNGEEKVYIDPGVTVIVTQIGTGAFSFTSTGFDYPAAGPNYVPGGDIDATPAKDVITDNGNGVDKHSITIGEGEDVVAYFELLTATGDDIEGSFVSTEYAAEAGMLCNGWEFPDCNISGGSYVMKDGVKEFVAPGVTVEVTKLADGVYKFVGPDYEFVAEISK